VAYDILKCTGVRVTSPEIIACPSCGRIDIDLEAIVAQVKERLATCTLPVKISVLGCAVNGPGEAREADIGIAGGAGVGLLFRNGETVRKVAEADIVDALIEEIAVIEAERVASGDANAALGDEASHSPGVSFMQTLVGDRDLASDPEPAKSNDPAVDLNATLLPFVLPPEDSKK
jgi:hypothetical protein